LAALLAEACGWHIGPDCDLCADAVAHRRDWGWTDQQIVDDVSLYLRNRPEWYRLAVERAETRRQARLVTGQHVPVPPIASDARQLLAGIQAAVVAVDPVPEGLADRCADAASREDDRR
jgi:hypothetical protein